MAARIDELCEAVKVRLLQLDLVADVDVEPKSVPILDSSQELTRPVAFVSSGGMTFERTGRGHRDLLRRSKVVVAVYCKVPVNSQTGEVDEAELKQSNELLEQMAELLAPSWMRGVANDPPPEIRQFYHVEKLLSKGVNEAVLVVSFAEDLE